MNIYDEIATLTTGDLALRVDEIVAPKEKAALVFSSGSLSSVNVPMRHLKAIVTDSSLFQDGRRGELVTQLLSRVSVQGNSVASVLLHTYICVSLFFALF